MKNGIISFGASMVLLFLSNCILAQNVEVEVGDVNLSIPLNTAECSTAIVGQSFSFTRTSNCTGTILITLDGNEEKLNTSEFPPLFTFDEPGQYVIFCNAASDNSATPKLCYSVSPSQSVPTLNEWGLICLLLLLLIFTAVSQIRIIRMS